MPIAIIFDVDGTLVDSVGVHAQAWVDAFLEFGHPVAFDEVRRQIGKGGDQLMPVFLDPPDLARIGEQLEARRGEILKQRYLHEIAAFPDVPSLFQRIRRDGKRIVLASSAKQPELEHYKLVAGITDLLDEQTSSDDTERSKPHPDILLAALARLGDPDPQDVIMVGDSPFDAEAASKAGMPCVGMLCGGFARADLEAAGCVAIYQDPADLLRRYGQSPLR